MLTHRSVKNRLESLLEEIQEVISSIEAIRADDDQYEDTDETWLYAMKNKLNEALKELEENI